MAQKSIDQVFDEILEDAAKIGEDAILDAARDIQKDIQKVAQGCLKMYYRNYIPKEYSRTDYLKKSIKPVRERKLSKKTTKKLVEVGVEYDSSLLKGHYKSNSRYHQSGDTWISKNNRSIGTDNGIPEPEWILENFLTGVHPWAQVDEESTYSLMDEFLNVILPTQFNTYVYDNLVDIIDAKIGSGR